MNEELKIIISAEVGKLRHGVEDAKKHLNTFKGYVKEHKEEITQQFKQMGDGVVNAAKKMGTGIAAAGAALLAVAGSTEEYRNQQAQLKTAFETAGASAATATETYNGLYRVLGDGGQAQEAAQHLAKLTTEEKALNEWTTICQGVYATFGASLPIESLTEAANETAKTGSLTGALADALNWAGVSETEFQAKLDATNNEAEREALIRETLNGLYTDAATNYETNNAEILKQRDAQAKLQEELAKVGGVMAPIMTMLTELGGKILAKIAPYLETFVANHLPTLQNILNKVAEAIGNIFDWIIDNWDWLSKLGEVILVIAAAFTALSVVMGVVNTVMTILSMNPIVLAITAIVAAIALCIVYWEDIMKAAKNAWEGIKKVWDKVAAWFGKIVDGIKEVFSGIADWFKNLFSKAWEGIKNAWNSVKQWFSNLWDGIKKIFNAVVDYYKNLFTNAWNAIKNAWAAVKQWFSNLWDGIKNVFNAVGTWFKDIFTKAWDGIKNAWGAVKDWFASLWDGIKNVFSAVGDWFAGIFTKAWEGIKNAFSGIVGFFTGIWDSIKNVFSKVGTAIADAIKGAVSKAVNTVLSIAVKIINGFISAINFAIGIINKIPGVNIKTLNKLEVPQMAKGGVVDSATLALIGERGKEAVMPLENNLEWLDKLAGMLNDRMGGGNQSIVMNVDGKRFAEISVDSINNLTRQRGSIPLVIA